jgi:hypothetical protein
MPPQRSGVITARPQTGFRRRESWPPRKPQQRSRRVLAVLGVQYRTQIGTHLCDFLLLRARPHPLVRSGPDSLAGVSFATTRCSRARTGSRRRPPRGIAAGGRPRHSVITAGTQVHSAVEYGLTDPGFTLSEPVGAIREWAEKHGEAILTARQRYERSEAAARARNGRAARPLAGNPTDSAEQRLAVGDGHPGLRGGVPGPSSGYGPNGWYPIIGPSGWQRIDCVVDHFPIKVSEGDFNPRALQGKGSTHSSPRPYADPEAGRWHAVVRTRIRPPPRHGIEPRYEEKGWCSLQERSTQSPITQQP